MFKYHLNFQNDLRTFTCKFVTHNLPKNSKSTEKKKTLQDPKWQPSVQVQQT